VEIIRITTAIRDVNLVIGAFALGQLSAARAREFETEVLVEHNLRAGAA